MILLADCEGPDQTARLRTFWHSGAHIIEKKEKRTTQHDVLGQTLAPETEECDLYDNLMVALQRVDSRITKESIRYREPLEPSLKLSSTLLHHDNMPI